MPRIILMLISVFITTSVKAQVDYSWWNEKHNWDGYTHWTQYLILSSAYLGPNALPVPGLYPGEIPSEHKIDIGVEGHYSVGDQTANSYLNYVFPLFTDRASIQIVYRTIEIYQTDTLTRDLRRSRQLDPEGTSLGDVYVRTFFQLIKDHSYLPDVVLSANIKTASGTNLTGARHTDTPGYWFDITIGRNVYPFGVDSKPIRPYMMAGFYSYQQLHFNEYQNDALLYGAGLQVSLKKTIVNNQLTGYHGYFNNGDRPMVYRLKLESNTFTPVKLLLQFEQGIHDFHFTSILVGMRLQLPSNHVIK